MHHFYREKIELPLCFNIGCVDFTLGDWPGELLGDV